MKAQYCKEFRHTGAGGEPHDELGDIGGEGTLDCCIVLALGREDVEDLGVFKRRGLVLDVAGNVMKLSPASASKMPPRCWKRMWPLRHVDHLLRARSRASYRHARLAD